MRYSVVDDFESYLAEFADSRGWKHMLVKLDELAYQMMEQAARSDDKHQYHKGLWEGVLKAKAHLLAELDRLKKKG